MTHSYATDLKHFDRMLLGGYWGYTSKMWLKHFGSSMQSIEKSSMYRLDEDLKIHFFQYLQSIYGNR